MAYTAPDIKDRVAIGDNQYIMQDLGEGKILLTPAPDEVVEPGTDINKALLQPLFDKVANIDNLTVPEVTKLIPYNQYYWLSRGISGYYSEVQTLAWDGSDYTSLIGFDTRIDIIYLFRQTSSNEDTSCTVNYSSSININPSTGAVSLVSPNTKTFVYEYGSQIRDTITSTLSGKFVTGLRPSTTKVFYVTPSSTVEYISSSSSSYTGYSWTRSTSGSSSAYGDRIMLVTSKYNSTNSPWGVISSTEPDTYPASGTVDGTEYIKLGRIDEALLNYAVNNPSAFKGLVASYEARISALEAAIAGI